MLVFVFPKRLLVFAVVVVGLLVWVFPNKFDFETVVLLWFWLTLVSFFGGTPNKLVLFFTVVWGGLLSFFGGTPNKFELLAFVESFFWVGGGPNKLLVFFWDLYDKFFADWFPTSFSI